MLYNFINKAGQTLLLETKIQAYKHGSVVYSYTPIIFFSKSSSPKLAIGFMDAKRVTGFCSLPCFYLQATLYVIFIFSFDQRW